MNDAVVRKWEYALDGTTKLIDPTRTVEDSGPWSRGNVPPFGCQEDGT